MPDSLVNPPWYVIGGLALAALILLYYGTTMALKALRWAGLAAAVLVVVALLAGRFFETGVARVTRQTKEFVAAADKRDWKTFAKHLDPKVRLAMFYSGKDELTKGAELTVEKVGVTNIAVSGIEVKEEPGGYTVDFTATADISSVAHRLPTSWRFAWAKNPAGDGYLLYKIDYVPNQQLGSDPVMSRLARP